MPQIITITNEIAKCPVCGAVEFEIVPHPELPAQMAFCVDCQQGKDISQFQLRFNVGTISRSEFEEKYQEAT